MDNRSYFLDLPLELLVKILSYLPTRDRFMARYISQRFRDATKIPSLWKDFVMPDYEPRHVRKVSEILKAHGEHVRHIFFPAHVTPANILEMARCCVKVTHLTLPRDTQLTLDDLEEIVHIMTCLQHLDMFTSGISKTSVKCGHKHSNLPYSDNVGAIGQFFKIIATSKSLKILSLRIDETYAHYGPHIVLELVENLFKRSYGHILSINLLIHKVHLTTSSDTLESWLSSNLCYIMPLKVGLYDIRRAPMDLYPSIPLKKLQFGPTTTPPFIKLSDHGILGLRFDTFYLCDYDHYGEIRHSITPKRYDLHVVKQQHLNLISNLYSVSNVDFSCMSIYPRQLKQLAVACPNLERINLMNASNFLQNLEGLCAVVENCQNLQGLNLTGLSASSVESFLLLWQLLSGAKKLSHLAIELCILVNISKCSDIDKQKIMKMFKNCNSLKALELVQPLTCYDCTRYNPEDLVVFSNFASLMYVRLCSIDSISVFNSAIASCRCLKYLCYKSWLYDILPVAALPSSSVCHLQQLCIDLPNYIDLSVTCVQVVSAHGSLEKVALFVRSITTDAITALISHSPNLTLLYIVIKESLCDKNGAIVESKDCRETISKAFSHHKLLTTGDFVLLKSINRAVNRDELLGCFDVNFNSLW